MSSRRGDEPLSGAAREIWKPIEILCDHGGERQGRVFEDWIELMLQALCSLAWNFQQGTRSFADFAGPHEAAYLAIAARYTAEAAKGQRGIDLLAEGYARLAIAVRDDPWSDPLGEIYEARVSYGEHGQFFTPMPVCAMMAAIQGETLAPGARVLDPACGSGRTLLAMAERERRLDLHGVDLDGRCARMAALNLALRELTGTITEGDSLRLTERRRWRIWRGFLSEIPIVAEAEAPAAPLALSEALEPEAAAFAAGRLF